MGSHMKKIMYTLKHKIAFLKVEKTLLGHNTIRGFLHDMDKVFLYMFLPNKLVQKIHRNMARHHDNNKQKSKEDYVEMIIDWECARFTKPDKPLNAEQTLRKFYPHLREQIEPLLVELGLKNKNDLFEVAWNL